MKGHVCQNTFNMDRTFVSDFAPVNSNMAVGADAFHLVKKNASQKICLNVSTTPLRQWGFSAMFTFQLDNTKR